MANFQPRVRCDCNRSFATHGALAQHQRDSPHHQKNPQRNNTTNDAVSTLISEDVTKGKAATPVIAGTEPTPTINASSTPAPDQKPSAGQKKRNKKKDKNSRKSQTSASSGPSTFNPTRHYGYTLGEGLGYPRYSSPMYFTWEDEYKLSGPDHTQCSRDCDWCGMCIYRDPF
ncbi:hypothetical protein F4782DRAFT_35004 [Xylaria castorea]|nr:hypothetical protein F4782DRAFT_35004 [Xylaria castorea]